MNLNLLGIENSWISKGRGLKNTGNWKNTPQDLGAPVLLKNADAVEECCQ